MLQEVVEKWGSSLGQRTRREWVGPERVTHLFQDEKNNMFAIGLNLARVRTEECKGWGELQRLTTAFKTGVRLRE